MTILVTGGAGFIGSNFVLDWFKHNNEPIINLDKLTYAGNLMNLTSLENDDRHTFIHADINDRDQVNQLLTQHQVRAIVHFAAESHVDRSIHGPDAFVQTNINGTFTLLETARQYWNTLPTSKKENFRFIHISTDEVFGSLSKDAPAFTETHRYEPNSPYSASKAASDHLVRAYNKTYNFPTVVTHCSNNYGPYHFPEKLIPLCIHNALTGKPIPIYGDGQQIRDWLHVSDHCSAIRCVLDTGTIGEEYNIGGWNEMTNIDVITLICKALDQKKPRQDGQSYTKQFTYVSDRPGHDRRYAIDASKIANELNWKPQHTFESGLEQTVSWFLNNQEWVNNIVSGEYLNWITRQYA